MPKRRITVKELQEWIEDEKARTSVEGYINIKVKKNG